MTGPTRLRTTGRVALRSSIAVGLLVVALGQAAPAVGEGLAEAREPTRASAQPDPAARAWILIDAGDDRVLAAKAAGRRLPIASTTKMMTAYTAIRLVSPERTIVVRPYRAEGVESLAGLQAGKRMRVEDALYAMLLPSGNDAASTLAIDAAGSTAEFVRAMNREAARLGLDDSSFSNPIGLDEKNNFSSARDLAVLGTEVLRDDLLRRIVGTRATRVPMGGRKLRLVNRNELLAAAPWVNGVKTGFTGNAGYSLVASGEQGGVTLVAALLGAPTEAARYAGGLELLRWGFARYRQRVEAAKGEELGEVGIADRFADVPLVASQRLAVLLRPGQRAGLELALPDAVEGPVRKGQRIGSAVATVDGRPVESVPLAAARSERAAGWVEVALGTILSPLGLVPLGVILLLTGGFLAWRGRGGSFPDGESGS